MELPKYSEIMNIERYALYKEKNSVDESTGKFIIEEKVDEDMLKEWQEVIYKELYSSFEYDIRRAFTRGLAEYYKKKIYDNIQI